MGCSNVAIALLVIAGIGLPMFAIIEIGLNNAAAGEIRAWASKHSLSILNLERCLLFKGPFFFSAGFGERQARPRVFRIIARDPKGDKRFGYVSHTNYADGSPDENTVVIWDGDQ